MTQTLAALETFLGKDRFSEDRELQLQALADAIPLIVWTANPNGDLDYYNRQWETYTGYTCAETVEFGWGQVLHPDDLQACIDRWTQASTSGEPYQIEYRFKRATDGAYRWHLGRAIPFKDASGRILKWLGTGTDIDDQIRAKEHINQALLGVEAQVKERTAELASVNQMLLRQNEIRKSAVETLQQDSTRLNEIITTQHQLAEAALNLQAFITLVIERMASLTSATGVVVEMLEGNEIVSRAAAGTNVTPTTRRLKLDNSLTSLCINSRQVLHCQDTESDPRVSLAECRKAKARSIVVAPLFHSGNSVGVLKIISQEAHAFSERDVQTLQLMAGFLGAAIGHQADYEANRRLLAGRTEALDALKSEIEHRARVEEAIRDNEWRTRMIIESSYDAFVAIDANGVITDWNQQAEVTFGWGRQDAIGAILGDLIIPERYRLGHRSGMKRFLATGEGAVLNKPIELIGLRRGGEEFPVELTIRALQYQDGYEFCAFLRDITERKNTEQKLLQLSQNDPLTDLPGRNIFNDRIAEAMKRNQRTKTKMALLLLDIDALRETNDAYGHKVGDSLLKEFARRLRVSIRAADTVARLGGDEFGIILEELKRPADAEMMATKIMNSVRKEMQVDNDHFSLTASIGIAYFKDELDADQLIHNADQAMYRAKQAGRDCISS